VGHKCNFFAVVYASLISEVVLNWHELMKQRENALGIMRYKQK